VELPAPRRLSFRLPALAALCALAGCVAAHALEHVNLRNGFSYDCTRREPLGDGHIRLYLLSAGSDTASYIDLPAEAIASVELVPDPPKPAPPAAAAITSSPAASPDVPTLLARAGARHAIDADLLASIVKVESAGRVHAVSRAGARGLMQLMPATARELGVDDAFEPAQNIDGGTAYLDALLDRYDPRGDRHGLDLAIAAYNAGPAAVDRYHGIPPFAETRAYVARVEAEFVRRKRAASAAH